MSATTRQPNFALLLGLAWLLVVFQLARAELGRDRADAARHRRRDAARADARLARRAGLVRPASAARAAAGRLRVALVAADRCRACRHAVGLRPVRRRRAGRAADAHRRGRCCGCCPRWPARRRSPGASPAARPRWSRCCSRWSALPAFQQFRPGRIDHHNVQIALSVLAVAATVWSDRVRWAAYAAGAAHRARAGDRARMPALSAGLRARRSRCATCVDRDGARAAARLRACARRSLGRRVPRRSSGRITGARGVCDAIAINWLALVVIGGLGLWLGGTLFAQRRACRAARLRRSRPARRRRRRCSCWIEPRCLRGPLRHDGPGGVADLARRMCARCSR